LLGLAPVGIKAYLFYGGAVALPVEGAEPRLPLYEAWDFWHEAPCCTVDRTCRHTMQCFDVTEGFRDLSRIHTLGTRALYIELMSSVPL
jgi:hypothetical protein